MKFFKGVCQSTFYVVYTTLICMFFFGCTDQLAETKTPGEYTLSQSDIEFQRNANRPPTAKTMYSMAKIFVYQGRFSDAEYLLQRVINEYPEFMPAYNDLAEIKIRRRRTQDAIEVLSMALEKNRTDPTILNNLGMCWMIRKDYQKALDKFTEASGLEPENTRYRANMATALGLLGREEEALSLYKQILPVEQANKNLYIIREARSSEKQ